LIISETMQNEQENNPKALTNERIPIWVWLFPMCGLIDLAAYCSFLIISLPIADWTATLIDNAVLPMMVAGQGISCAFLVVAVILAVKTALIKKRYSFKQLLFINALGFVLLGLIPPLIFLPDRNNSDFGFGVALIPFFFYPIFNIVRLVILLLVSTLAVKSAGSK